MRPTTTPRLRPRALPLLLGALLLLTCATSSAMPMLPPSGSYCVGADLYCWIYNASEEEFTLYVMPGRCASQTGNGDYCIYSYQEGTHSAYCHREDSGAGWGSPGLEINDINVDLIPRLPADYVSDGRWSIPPPPLLPVQMELDATPPSATPSAEVEAARRPGSTGPAPTASSRPWRPDYPFPHERDLDIFDAAKTVTVVTAGVAKD